MLQRVIGALSRPDQGVLCPPLLRRLYFQISHFITNIRRFTQHGVNPCTTTVPIVQCALSKRCLATCGKPCGKPCGKDEKPPFFDLKTSKLYGFLRFFFADSDLIEITIFQAFQKIRVNTYFIKSKHFSIIRMFSPGFFFS